MGEDARQMARERARGRTVFVAVVFDIIHFRGDIELNCGFDHGIQPTNTEA
jgi:hypothetical protein